MKTEPGRKFWKKAGSLSTSTLITMKGQEVAEMLCGAILNSEL